MSTHEDRLKALREQLAGQQLTGFVVPLTDEHMSEYVGAYAQRLQWLTGFDGSAGSAVVLPDRAAMFTDGRYTLQVRDQVDGRLYSYESVPETSVAAWLGEHAPAGAGIGYDPWLHTRAWVKAVAEKLADKGARLVPLPANPIDLIWRDRPQPSAARLVVHPEQLAGRSSADKRRGIAEAIAKAKADAVVLSALDSIAWTFNIRGRDVARTPVALAYAIVHADATADIYVAPEKLDEAVRAHLGPEVRLHPREAFVDGLAALAGKRVSVDPANAVAAIFEALEGAGATVVEARDPAILPKAIKTGAEIAGARAAHVRDGAALTRFLHWFATQGADDELQAVEKLEAFRRDTGALEDLSFDTIAGAGPNGAIVHYRVTPETNRKVEQGLFLLDSGGQYVDGTTDVTRTIAVGEPTAEMRENFTRVLKGHIGLARAVFPAGTRGSQLDVLARRHLWEAGLDYAHGTGHGVGSYLSVHEGPQRISGAGGDEPLAAGMILSNEPGYYKSNSYGIRIENLVLVTAWTSPSHSAEKPFLSFETLTLAPIDRTLINPAMLDDAERLWLNDYHRRVLTQIGPLVPQDVRLWLETVTQPL